MSALLLETRDSKLVYIDSRKDTLHARESLALSRGKEQYIDLRSRSLGMVSKRFLHLLPTCST
jgi:hypothetical protein